MTADGYEVSLRDDKNFLELDMVMVAQLCEYSKTPDLYTLKG